jgi:uncharacterized membrane protein YtjA (UPF0391 family)
MGRIGPLASHANGAESPPLHGAGSGSTPGSTWTRLPGVSFIASGESRESDERFAAAHARGCGSGLDHRQAGRTKEHTMLYYAIVFLIIALIAGFFGFFGVAGLAGGIAKILFVIFIILFIVSLIFGRRR